MSRMIRTTPTPPASEDERRSRRGRECVALVGEVGSLEHIVEVLDILNERYGYDDVPPDGFSTGEPLDGLVLTVLSQNTNDRNRDRAYAVLRERYPEWSVVASIAEDELADAIRPAGLGDTKAARIKLILSRIREDFGAYTLVSMKDWEPGAVSDYLLALPGVGPKTVGCVMAFDLGMPAFPVDTHVARISRRLGWAGEKESPEKIQLFLESTVPPGRCRGGHLNMIAHGREICRARAPSCGLCPLSSICRSAAADGEPAGRAKV